MRGERDAATAVFKWAGHFLGHFHFLGGAAGEQRGINTRQNVLERETDLAAVILAAGIGKESGAEAAEFAESDFYRAKSELVDDGIHRQRNGLAGLGKAHEFGLQIHGQHADNGCEWKLEDAGGIGRGCGCRGGVRGSGGGFITVRQRCGRRRRLAGGGTLGRTFPLTEKAANEACKF